MTAENTPAAKQSWWCWAGQDVAGCDLGRQGGEQQLPELQPSTKAGPAQPLLGLWEVSQPPWDGGDTHSWWVLQPKGACPPSEASAPCFSLTTEEPLPPCTIPPPEGHPTSFPRGRLAPARQPPQGLADPTDLGQLSLFLSHSITVWHPKQDIFTRVTLAGLERVLEARHSFCISQQYSFFNLLSFFSVTVQGSCPVLSLQSITSPSSFLQSSCLASFSLYLFRLPLLCPVFVQLNLALVLVNTLLFFLALSLIYEDRSQL